MSQNETPLKDPQGVSATVIRLDDRHEIRWSGGTWDVHVRVTSKEGKDRDELRGYYASLADAVAYGFIDDTLTVLGRATVDGFRSALAHYTNITARAIFDAGIQHAGDSYPNASRRKRPVATEGVDGGGLPAVPGDGGDALPEQDTPEPGSTGVVREVRNRKSRPAAPPRGRRSQPSTADATG